MNGSKGTNNYPSHLLEVAVRESAIARDILANFGDRSVTEYLTSLGAVGPVPVQAREDLFRAISGRVLKIYGAELAARTISDLRARPVALTANHHGIDTFADSVQGNLLWGLRDHPESDFPPSTILVLAFTSISLNNLSYPMGFRFYDPCLEPSHQPRRLRLLPAQNKLTPVFSAPPIDISMVKEAEDRLRRLKKDGKISSAGHGALQKTIQEILLSPDVISSSSYIEQSSRIGTRFWKSMFPHLAKKVDIVLLEIESVCKDVIVVDILTRGSMLNVLLFDRKTRRTLIETLDCQRACWKTGELQLLVSGTPPAGRSAGTMFFWAKGEAGERVALLCTEDGGMARLEGRTDAGTEISIELAPDVLVDLLEAGQIVPSLFTCFATIALSRGIRCLGGYYQVAYLPVIKRGVSHALRESNPGMADAITGLPTELCLAGMQCISQVSMSAGLIPAGPIEISYHGGLTPEDLSRVMSTTVREAYMGGLIEMFQHIVPNATLPPDWGRRVARDNFETRNGAVFLDATT